MSEGVDLEVFRDIPGYKGILKAVLKSQIQLLLHQLAQLAGEETVLLSASVSDGTFGYLGSDFGKDFIKGNDEYKAKFLCFCMEKHHKRKTAGKPRSFAERFASHMQRSKGFHAARKFASSTPKSSSVKYQSLLNTGSKGKKRQAEGNPSSEVGSKKEKTLDESGTGTPNGQQIGVPLHSELDPDNSMDYSKIIIKQEQSRDDPEDTDTAEGHKTGEDDEDIPGQMQSADYVLDQGSDETGSPLPWDLNGASAADRQTTSKRKQFVPTRHVQTGIIDEDTEAALFMKFAYGEDINKENNITESPRRMSPLSLPGGVAKVNLNWSTDGEYSMQSDRGEPSYYDSSDMYGAKYIKSEAQRMLDESSESKYYKAPQLDGLLVSRGEGRYEKLIKCDICGKVCRTSNMARHKKRYCTGFPKGAYRHRVNLGKAHSFEAMDVKQEFQSDDFGSANERYLLGLTDVEKSHTFYPVEPKEEPGEPIQEPSEPKPGSDKDQI